MHDKIIYYNLAISIVITVVSFCWIPGVKNDLKKLLYIFIALFYYMYCGITSFYVESQNYMHYYFVYTVVLGYTFYKTRDLSFEISSFNNDFFYKNVIKKFANIFMLFYISTFIFKLIYPENRIINLFVPPSPDISIGIEKQVEGHSVLDSLNYLFNILFFCFLSAYIDRYKILILLYSLITYLSYVTAGYISRGSILRLFVVIFLLLYFKYPQKRKMLIAFGIAVSFFLVIFFVSYIYIRMGDNVSLVSFSFAIEKLADIEFSFSKYFDDMLHDNVGEPLRFLWWFVSMPLPGFMKFGTAEYLLNIEYTEKTLGVYRDAPFFFTILPGLVIEGVYAFGTTLYFIHAALFAVVVNVTYNTLLKSKAFFVLCIYFIINIPLLAVRAGTISFYPTTNKLLPYAFLILLLLYRYLRYTR